MPDSTIPGLTRDAPLRSSESWTSRRGEDYGAARSWRPDMKSRFVLLVLSTLLLCVTPAGPAQAAGPWHLLTPNGAPGSPPPRVSSTSSAWDGAHQRMLVFGGFNGGYLNDLWEYTPSSGWHILTADGA